MENYLTNLEAPLAADVVRILVSPGEQVVSGQDIVVINAMKMELPLSMEINGVVEAILVAENEVVQKGQVLVTFKPV